MLPLFINLMLILGLSGVVAYTVYSYQRSSEIVSLAQRNAARMDQVGFTIKASLRPVEMGGRVRAPLGDPAGPPVAVRRAPGNPGQAADPADQPCIDGLGDYQAGNPSAAFNAGCRRMGVPAWIVSDDRTPWGARYTYCPYSLDPFAGAGPANLPSTAGAIRTGDGAGGSYRVRVVRSRGRDYVLQSDNQAIRKVNGTDPDRTTASEEVVGFLLSPPPFVAAENGPSCSDVAKVDGAWIVSPSPGNNPGSVVPILSRGIATGQIANQGEVVIYAAQADINPNGVPATGDRPTDALSLANVLDLWHLTPWKATTINVASGTYGFAASDVVPGGAGKRLGFETPYPGRSLSLRSSDGGQVQIQSNGTDVVDFVIGVDATLDRISLGKGIQLRIVNGARVTVTNGALHHVRVDGGDLTLGVGASVTEDTGVNASTGVDVTSGRLRLSGGSFGLSGPNLAGAGIYVMGGEFVLDGTDLSMTLASGARTVIVQEGSHLSVSPKAAGGMPSVSVTGGNGTLSGTIGADMNAYSQCASGGDTCVAACTLATESPGLLRTAMGGSCSAQDFMQGDGQPAAASEARPELFRSARGDVVTGLAPDSATWLCRWKPGQIYSATPLPGGGTINSYYGPATFPTLRASARCAPNPTLVSP